MSERARPTQLELATAAVRVPEHVVYRTFAHEVVALNLKTGRYHGLNPTAGAMLTALERNATVGEAAVSLAAHYERPLEEIERDLRDLCVDLLERGLIELVNSDGSQPSGRQLS
jgi:Coenzyme PQQ synthesis protein D (PqqD)